MNREQALALVRKYGAACVDRRGPDAAEHCMALVEALMRPRIWYRPESPPGLEAVRDCDGKVWRRHSNRESPLFHDRWVCDDSEVHVVSTWLQLLESAPLIEVSA